MVSNIINKETDKPFVESCVSAGNTKSKAEELNNCLTDCENYLAKGKGYFANAEEEMERFSADLSDCRKDLQLITNRLSRTEENNESIGPDTTAL